jgi:hypothetical protein
MIGYLFSLARKLKAQQETPALRSLCNFEQIGFSLQKSLQILSLLVVDLIPLSFLAIELDFWLFQLTKMIFARGLDGYSSSLDC